MKQVKAVWIVVRNGVTTTLSQTFADKYYVSVSNGVQNISEEEALALIS